MYHTHIHSLGSTNRPQSQYTQRGRRRDVPASHFQGTNKQTQTLRYAKNVLLNSIMPSRARRSKAQIQILPYNDLRSMNTNREQENRGANVQVPAFTYEHT